MAALKITIEGGKFESLKDKLSIAHVIANSTNFYHVQIFLHGNDEPEAEYGLRDWNDKLNIYIKGA